MTLVLLGFAFRAWQISSVGLDHFDEGVYAFSALGLTDPGQPYRLYPQQITNSPPAFFGLVGLTYYALGGPSDIAPIAVNVLLGTLTIVLLWWVGRSWFGPVAGIAAAALLVFNEYHIALTRTALTDVAFAFFLLLALGAIGAAIRNRSVGFAIVAGLAAGLAWNTKYNGWFALVIAGAAILPFALLRYVRGEQWLRYFAFGLIAVAVAAACYLPWALYVQSQPGGYASLLTYQRTFVDHHQWLQRFWQQAQQQLFLEGPLSRSSILLALLCALLISGVRTRSGIRFPLLIVLLSAAVLLIGGVGVTFLLALLAIPVLLRRPARYPTWLLLIWLGLWFLSTPLYQPYARLVLPFTIASQLAAGVTLSAAIGRLSSEKHATAWKPNSAAAIASLVVLAVALVMPDPSNPWRPSRSVPDAVEAMERFIPPGSRVIVVAEPELAFYFHLADRPAFERLENPAEWRTIATPVYMVTGVYAKRAPPLREGINKLAGRLQPLGVFTMDPKDIRLLDDFSTQEARRFRAQPDDTYELTLYHLVPETTAP